MLEQVTSKYVRALGQPLMYGDVKSGFRHGASERIAAEGRAVGAGLE
jgi:hypothetical protein